jgi:CBS domain-containing protein
MTTDLYKVKVDDAIDLVAHLMHWKQVGHVPVEDGSGQLAGMITRNTLIDHMLKAPAEQGPLRAGELMSDCTLQITPETPLQRVVQLMLDNAVSCLPVTSNGSIVRLVTGHDVVKVAHALLGGREQQGALP